MLKSPTEATVLVFGMDGNVLDNYSIKAECAGRALVENAQKYFNKGESQEFFSNIYIETSGKNSLEQIRIAYEQIGVKDIPREILEQTEQDFRSYLDDAQEEVRMFPEVELFLKRNSNRYIFTITTTVPIIDMDSIDKNAGLSSFFQIICARHGYLEKGILNNVPGFDKGPQHYNLLLKKFLIPKQGLIAISSTKQDIVNAKQFGIKSIAVEHIFTAAELKIYEPDNIVHDFSELDALLEVMS